MSSVTSMFFPSGGYEFKWPTAREPHGWTRVTGSSLPQPVDVKFRIAGRTVHITAVRIENDRPITSTQLRDLRLGALAEELTQALLLETSELTLMHDDLSNTLENSLHADPTDAAKFYFEEREAVAAGAADWSVEARVFHDMTEVGMTLEAMQGFIEAQAADVDSPLSKRGRGAKPPTYDELSEFARIYRHELESGERGAKSRTARRVGMDRTTVYRWIPMCQAAGLLTRPRKQER